MIRLHTNKGTIDIELHQEEAPETCKNFLAYVDSGHYDGTVFHRVIPSFMVQGGGFTEDMSQKPTQKPIENEAANGLVNDLGTVAMARTSDPHSASSQFFINVNDNKFLNHTSPSADGWGYCVFGKITSDMDVVMGICTTPTGNVAGHGDVPLEPIVIERAERIEAA